MYVLILFLKKNIHFYSVYLPSKRSYRRRGVSSLPAEKCFLFHRKRERRRFSGKRTLLRRKKQSDTFGTFGGIETLFFRRRPPLKVEELLRREREESLPLELRFQNCFFLWTDGIALTPFGRFFFPVFSYLRSGSPKNLNGSMLLPEQRRRVIFLI